MYALSTRSVHFIHENLSVITIEIFHLVDKLTLKRSTKYQCRIDVKTDVDHTFHFDVWLTLTISYMTSRQNIDQNPTSFRRHVFTGIAVLFSMWLNTCLCWSSLIQWFQVKSEWQHIYEQVFGLCCGDMLWCMSDKRGWLHSFLWSTTVGLFSYCWLLFYTEIENRVFLMVGVWWNLIDQLCPLYNGSMYFVIE